MASTYLTRTNSVSSSTYTFSAWVKHTAVGVNDYKTLCLFGTDQDASSTMSLSINNTDKWNVYNGSGHTSSNAVARDSSGWYNVVLKVDNLSGTIYVNNESVLTGITCKATGTVSNHMIVGAYGASGNEDYWNGLMSHVHFIDGTAYDATAFGEYDANGVWTIIVEPSVTYGTNGFFILKDGNSVTDQSGNSNNFTVAGGTLTNTEDCPDNVFATMNPLAQTLSGITYSGGNTISTMTGDVGQRQSISTLGMPSGKFYMECKLQAVGSTGGSFPYAGIVAQEKYDADTYVGSNGTGWVSSGDIYNGGSNSSTGVSYTTGDIIGLAVDIDNSKLYWHKNGTYILSGNPSTGANGYDISARTAEGTLGFGVSSWNNNGIWQANFGNGYFGTTAVASAGTNASGIGIFEYDVPTGYTALSTKGLNL